MVGKTIIAAAGEQAVHAQPQQVYTQPTQVTSSSAAPSTQQAVYAHPQAMQQMPVNSTEGIPAPNTTATQTTGYEKAPAEPFTPVKESSKVAPCLTPPPVLPESKLSRTALLQTITMDVVVAKVKQNPPRLVLLDFDDTLMENPQNPRTNWKQDPKPWNDSLLQRATELEDLKARGVRIGIVTNRPLHGKDFGIVDLLVDRLPTAVRPGLILSIGGGAEVWELGEDGKVPIKPTRCVKAISEADRMKMQKFMRAAATSLRINTVMKEVPRGFENDDFLENNSISYEYCVVLYKPQRENFGELYASFEKQFNDAGLQETHEMVKKDLPFPADPYIRVRVKGAAKGAGVSAIVDLLGVAQTSTLYIGDEFGGEINGKPRSQDDSNVAEALPGCMAIDVGPSISASSLKNVYHIGGGAEKTNAFLKALCEGEKLQLSD